MRPTKFGVMVAAAGTVCAVLPAIFTPHLWPLWPAFWAVLLFGFAFDLLFSTRQKEVSCRLDAPEVLYIGEEAEARLTLQIPTRGTAPFDLRVDLSENLLPQPAFSGVCSAQGVEVCFSLIPKRRGTVKVERAWVRYRSPLKLMEAVAQFSLAQPVPVVPNIRPVRSAALRLSLDRSFRAGLKIERYKGDGTEFESLRDYLPGDDYRAIHWRASAKHKKPLYRQFRAERNHQVIMALDTGRLMSEPLGGGIPKMDHAINAALLLSYVCLRTGDRVGLFTFDAQVGLLVEPQAGIGYHRTLTSMTSKIDYSTSETNFTLGLTSLSQKLNLRSLILVLTDFVDTLTAELMLENLDRLARRHVVVFVSLRDPELSEIERLRPSSVLDLNRAVVADSHLRERGVVLKRLRRLGIYPIDAVPERIGTDLVNQYLEIKRRERI